MNTSDGFWIIHTPTHVSVSKRHSPVKMSSAEADEIEPGVWSVARVFVQEAHRGQGLGSRLLEALKAACLTQGATVIEVAPGGYGADPARQMAFYKRAGFRNLPSPKEWLLAYRKPE